MCPTIARGRGARALAQRRHLPLGLRALRGPLHHPGLVSDHPGPRVVGRDRRGRERRDHAAARATASSASVSSTTATTTSGSRSAAPNAEYFVAKASWLHRIPDELSFAQGAFVEPFSVAYSAAVAADGIDASDEVAVIGGGPIGLLCTMAAATMGGSVTLIEPQAHRRALGLEIGARRAIDPTAGPLSEQVAEATRGRGFDVVIEAAGVPAAMATRLPDRRARRAGRPRRHRRRRHRARRDRPRPVEGAPGARDHRLRRAVAAHDPLHGDERRRPDPAAHGHLPARRRRRRARRRTRHERATSRSRSSADVVRAAVFHGPRDVRIEERSGPGRAVAGTRSCSR